MAFSWNSHLLRNILGGKCLDDLVTISSYQWFELVQKYSENFPGEQSPWGKRLVKLSNLEVKAYIQVVATVRGIER